MARSNTGNRMKALTAKDAKYGLGWLIDLARAEPVAVAKHERPVIVVMAVEEFARRRRISLICWIKRYREALRSVDRPHDGASYAAGAACGIPGVPAGASPATTAVCKNVTAPKAGPRPIRLALSERVSIQENSTGYGAT